MSSGVLHRHFCQTCVMLSLRLFNDELKSEQGFLFFFEGGVKKIFYFFLVYIVYIVYLCVNKTNQYENI